MSFDAICCLVKTKPFGLNAGITSVFDCKGSQSLLESSTAVFFYLFAHPAMQIGHNIIKDTVLAPMLVVPEDSRIGRKISRQISPIATILELIKYTIEDLSFCPQRGSSFLLSWQ